MYMYLTENDLYLKKCLFSYSYHWWLHRVYVACQFKIRSSSLHVNCSYSFFTQTLLLLAMVVSGVIIVFDGHITHGYMMKTDNLGRL